MRKIEWKPKKSNEFVRARVGCLVLCCFSCFTKTSKKRWRADVSIQERGGTFRQAPICQSLAQAKKDAVRMARELLLDYHAAVTAEMKNFDLLE